MKRSVKSLIGFCMGATDGEIGKVKEFFFDDVTWTIRYIVVETGNWLNGRKVLIAPEALLTPDWKNEVFPVNLTKDKIKNSPDIDTEQPVSRQHEIALYKYYPWTSYWGGGIWGGSMGLSGTILPVHKPGVEAIRREDGNDIKDAGGDLHLRNTHKVTGYNILATDGKIGDVVDFIVDDTSWKLDYLVVDTGHWFPGKKVLVLPKLVKKIEWDDSEVIINVPEEYVKDSPEYEPGEAISESYAANLQNYYGDFVKNIY